MALISTTLGRLYNFQPGTKAYSQNMDDELDAILIGVNKIVADLITLDSVKSEVTTVTDITGVGRTTQTIMSNFLLSTLAIDTANISNATANTANTKSDTAVTTANSSSTKSDTAISTANGAVVTANAAATKATEVETDYNLVKPLLIQAIIDANDAVDLVETTIVGTVFDQVGIVSKDYVFTASVDGDNSFSIPFADYIPQYDYLQVMYDGIMLSRDVHYTAVERVVTILFNLLAGEKIAFRVSKNQMMPENYADGIWLEPGTVQKVALEQSLQDEINTLVTDLNTEEASLIAHKADLVSDSDGAHGLKMETGVWTPTLAGSTVTGVNSYVLQKGVYHKLGKLILIDATIILSAKDAAMAGTVNINGLPFLPSSGMPDIAITLSNESNINLGAGKKLSAYSQGSTNFIRLSVITDNANMTLLNSTAIANTTSLTVAATYYTA